MITEEMMAAAAAEMNEAMLRSLPEPEECYHEFSAKFEKKMKRVIYRADHPLQFRILQKVASIILVLFLGFATIMAISPTVRASVFGWIRDQYDSFITYFIDPDSQLANKTVVYSIDSLPPVYTLLNVSDEADNYCAVYVNEKGEFLYFCYSSTPDSSAFYANKDGYTIEHTMIHNNPADLYTSENEAQSNSIIWYCEEADLIFYIAGMLEKSDLVILTESVTEKVGG